jgi:hypothetical protein
MTFLRQRELHARVVVVLRLPRVISHAIHLAINQRALCASKGWVIRTHETFAGWTTCTDYVNDASSARAEGSLDLWAR